MNKTNSKLLILILCTFYTAQMTSFGSTKTDKGDASPYTYIQVHYPSDAVFIGNLKEGYAIYPSRFYAVCEIFDKDNNKMLVTLNAASAVIFIDDHDMQKKAGVYLDADVQLEITSTFGQHKITTDALYFNLKNNTVIAKNGVLKLQLSESRMALYGRAKEIRILNLDKGGLNFKLDELIISNDEFHTPLVYIGAKHASIEVPDPNNKPTEIKKQPTITLTNATVTIGKFDVIHIEKVTQTGLKIESPMRLKIGSSDRLGGSLETSWDLQKMMAADNQQDNIIQDAYMHLDAFSSRGPGVGVDVKYDDKTSYRGKLKAYFIQDEGEDTLSRLESRTDVIPEKSSRGRLDFRHKAHIAENVEATVEYSLASDADYLESWHEREFDTDKEKETLLYVKHQTNNRAFDIIGKWQPNNFDTTLTELPSVGFHTAGENLFDIFTYYQDSNIGRYREVTGDRQVPGFGESYETSYLENTISDNSYTYGTSRHEINMPMHYGSFSFTPLFIGTTAFEDGGDTLIDETNTSPQDDVAKSFDHHVFQTVFGFRSSMQFWRVNRNYKSRIWDLNQIRHIITPEVAILWTQKNDDNTPEQNIFHFGLNQKWQTKRTRGSQLKSVDFLTIDTALTFTNHDIGDAILPNHFNFSNPEYQYNRMAYTNSDLANLLFTDNSSLAQRQKLNQTYSDFATVNLKWQLSDTTMFASRANYNIYDAHFNEIYSALAVKKSARVSYYLSTRFLRNGRFEKDPFKNSDDKFEYLNTQIISIGSSYQLNKKYMVAASQRFDIETGQASGTELVFLRKNAKWFSTINFDLDTNRNEYSISFSFFPQGAGKIMRGASEYHSLVQ